MTDVLNALQLHQWYALAAALTWLALLACKKMPAVRGLYAKVPDKARWCLPLLAGAAEAFVGAQRDGLSWKQALVAAASGAAAIGLGAAGLHNLLTESPLPYNQANQP